MAKPTKKATKPVAKKKSAAKAKAKVRAKKQPAAKKQRAVKKQPAAKQQPAAKRRSNSSALVPKSGMTIRLKKIDMDAELEAELAAILAAPTSPKPAVVPTANTLSASEADKRVGDKWFTGYTNAVQLIDGPATVMTFDGASRGGDAEYLLFDQGLTVTGTLDLSSIYRSIIVVRGTLKAKRIILGDAVLVVEKAVRASELVFGPMTEGIFALAGLQIESDPEDLATAVDAPVVALYDRNQREWLVRRNGVPAELATDLIDDGEVDASALRKRVLAGASIFA